MTREQLVAENEALHGLLAAACEALDQIAVHRCKCEPCLLSLQVQARDTLAQIAEGAVK